MRLWLQILLEWLNCLDILETNINDLQELEDGKFYKKLIEFLSWKGAKDISNTKSVVGNFLHDEYPEFMFDGELTGEVEHIYIASVFLLHTSQEALFHRPMCNKLQHETQVKIKSFLEMIIPYGRNITRETLKTVITELGEDVPKTPGMPSLKEFFNSPVARSAQSYKLLSSKYRELRILKTELEVERFEKADLQEDLKIQQNKVLSLQKRLQEKGAEIKALRDERMRQNTPQSCKKSKRIVDYEQQYSRELDRLEDRLIQKQCEVDKLETENDTLSKKVTCAEKQCVYFREELVNFERTFENLQIQGEIKDRELLNLRAANEELQMHLNELNKMGVEEQSFEIDGVLPLNSSISHFNNSEALSSVIEIQLQEAKQESASLKTQLDILKKKLDSMTREYENVTELLREKTLISQTIENKLNTALNKLTQEVEALQEEKTSVINKNGDLEALSDSQKKSLSQLEEAKCILNTKVVTLKEKVKSTEESLHKETENNVKLNTALNKLTQEVEALQEEKTSVINKNRDLEALSDSQKKSLSQLEEAKCILNTKVVTLKEKVKSTEESLHKETENNVKLNTALNKLTQEVEALQEEKTSVINKNRDLEALSDSQKKSLSQLEEAKCILNTKVVTLKEKVKSTEESLHKETENNVKLNTALNKLTQEVEALQEEKTSVINKNRDLETLSDSQKKSLSQLEEAKCILNTKVVTLKEKVKSTEESLHKETENNVKLNTALNKLTQEVEALQEEKTSVINKNRDLETLSDSQKKSLSQLEEAKSILNTKVVTLKEKVKSTEESLHKETENNVKLNTALNKLTQEVEALQEEKTSVINKNRDLEALSDSQKKSLSQLEEAKCILNTKVVTLKEKVKSTEESLHKETENNVKLNIALNKLTQEVEALQEEKTSVINKNRDLETLSDSQKKSLSQLEEAKSILNTKVVTLKEKVKSIEESLHKETENNVKLNTALTETKLELQENVKRIQDLTRQNNLHKTNIENCNQNLKKIILHRSEANDIGNNNLDNATTIERVECLRILLHNFDERYVSKKMKVESLNSVMEEMKLKEQDYQSQISKLEGIHKQNIIDISKLEETIALNVTNINELTTTIHQCSKEISYLKQIEIEKQALEKDLNVLKAETNEKDLLLNSSKVGIKILKDNLRAFVAEFHLTKKDVLNQLNECQKQNKETIKNTLNAYEKLYNNFSKEQLYRKTVEDKLADNKKELKDSQNLNTTLENNLRKNEQTISDLERQLISTKEKLVESVQQLEKLEEAKGTLEKRHKSLKFQNEKILLDLNIINDKLKLSQEETYNMSDQLKFKDDKFGCLIEELASLKSEKEQIIHVQMEGELGLKSYIKELETKILEEQHRCDQLNTEAKLKQETLQNKFENLSKEATVSETKMKELITNLQEVRTNLGAVLTTQEKALKEKDLQIQQLQKEFNELKAALCKQLEDEKLLSQNLQSTNSDLHIQSYKQMESIEELQEILKRERTELDKSKEYCKAEDSKKLEISLACRELEHSVNSLKLTTAGLCPRNKNFYADVRNPICASKGDKSGNILNIIKSSINEMHASRELILHLSNINTNLNESLRDQKAVVDAKCEEIKSLNKQMQELKNVGKKHMEHLNQLIKHKESLRDYVQNIKTSREGLDVLLSEVKQKWDRLLTKSYYTFTMDKSACDELKHIQAKKMHLESTLSQYNIHHLQNMKPLQTILWQKFLWTEEILKDTCMSPTNDQQSSGISWDDFSDARTLIEEELQKNSTLRQDIILSQNEIDKFSSLVGSFESNFNCEETKFQSEAEKKLQLQIDELTEEKNDLGSKLDCARLQNAKFEGRIDELRNKIKELEAASSKEAESLKKEILQSKEEVMKLQEEKNELNKRPKKEDVDKQLKEIHDKYKIKYDEIKQNMKTAYNEQITKLNRGQEECVQERMELLQRRMELQCRKQADELSKYKSHVADMSSQIWNVGEKLLSEQQENEKLRKDLMELKVKYQNLEQQTVDSVEHKTSKFERRHLLPGENDKVPQQIAVIQEKTTYERRCSIRSIQTMGNAFNAEDEEGEVFDNTYLADMKNGHCSLRREPDRVSILQQRNALCKPHLKSSYPAEMQFHPPSLTEEEIKLGSVPDDVFNDSLSQSLLPEQKTKKRDRTQTSYKKPGPPTPSKNGGRLSLQGNELKSPSSRILRERNKDKGTTTPRTLKNLFSSKRHDENTAITPRGRRRSSIFRKHRVNDR